MIYLLHFGLHEGGRLRGRRMLVGGYGQLFCKRNAAGGAGHVAWGFWAADAYIGQSYIFGSYDNTTGNGREKAVWSDYGSPRAMVDEFKISGYDGWKYIYVPKDKMNISKARIAMSKWRDHLYFPFGANCMNMAHDILKAYGTPCLPYPVAHWRPKDYFDAFQGIVGNMNYSPNGKTPTGGEKTGVDLYDTSPIRQRLGV